MKQICDTQKSSDDESAIAPGPVLAPKSGEYRHEIFVMVTERARPGPAFGGEVRFRRRTSCSAPQLGSPAILPDGESPECARGQRASGVDPARARRRRIASARVTVTNFDVDLIE